MGKDRRRKRVRSAGRKSVNAVPDEFLDYGGLTVARYGKILQFSNTSTPEQHAARMELVRVSHQETLKKLETAVLKLQGLISKYDPLELMHRATYEAVIVALMNRNEDEYSHDESVSLPGAEYLQYLIARTKFDDPTTELSEEEWQGIWASVLTVLELTQTYLVTRQETQQSPEIDRLRFLIDGQRLDVRIKRYGCFFEDHARSCLGPYSEWILAAYGVTSEELANGLVLIQNYQKTGIRDKYFDMLDEQRKLKIRLVLSGYSVSENSTQEEIERTETALQSDDFRALFESAQEKSRLALTPAVLDITEVSSLPSSIMTLLSVRPSENLLHSLTGPDHDDLSPLSPSILHEKPFLEIDGRFYLTYHSGLEDRVSEIIERDLLRRFPDSAPTILEKRSDSAEELGAELLSSLVKPEGKHRNLYYPNPDLPGDLTELDILLVVDDILILGEVKGGGLSSGAKRGAPKDIAAELSDLIIKGQHQSERAERYIRSAVEVPLFDETGKTAVLTLRHSEFRKVFRVVITRENLGWVGAQIAILSVLDPNLSKSYPWHVSTDDLRAISELFQNNELIFVHFLEQRLTAAAQTNLSQHDELDHVALYHKLPYYYNLPPGADHVTFDPSFMVDIDSYFALRASGSADTIPAQVMPETFKLFIDELKSSHLPGRFEVASLVLSMPEMDRNDFDKSIYDLILFEKEGRHRSMRMPFTKQSTGLTLTFAGESHWEGELKVSAAQMLQSKCSRWLVARMQYSDKKTTISGIERLAPGMYSDEELEGARRHLEARVQETIQVKRVGRNEICPCGSGMKYKRCHGS